MARSICVTASLSRSPTNGLNQVVALFIKPLDSASRKQNRKKDAALGTSTGAPVTAGRSAARRRLRAGLVRPDRLRPRLLMTMPLCPRAFPVSCCGLRFAQVALRSVPHRIVWIGMGQVAQPVHDVRGYISSGAQVCVGNHICSGVSHIRVAIGQSPLQGTVRL